VRVTTPCVEIREAALLKESLLHPVLNGFNKPLRRDMGAKFRQSLLYLSAKGRNRSRICRALNGIEGVLALCEVCDLQVDSIDAALVRC
jgi:hypothetical protein